MPFWLYPILSCCLTGAILWVLLRSGFANRLAMDHPNERSLHERPVPRIGGLVAIPVALWCASASTASATLLAAAILLCLLSYADDRWGLPVVVRFGGHLAAAWAVAWSLPQPWMILPAVLAIAWMTNLYNFMDGANGLAGGMALFGFGALGWAGAAVGLDLAPLALALAGAAAGFLLFNFHPARVFMGDAGSIPLGFLAGAIGLEGAVRDAWQIWFPVLVFSPFIVDASVTLARRAWRGERVWQAHREHYYQRLVQLGWSHRRVALIEYALMLGAVVLGMLIESASPQLQMACLFLWGGLLAILMILIDRRWLATRQRRNA